MKERSRRISWSVGAALCVWFLAACDLNPQPLPPGATDNGGSTNVKDAGTAAAADAGFGTGGSTPSDASVSDAAPPVAGDDAGEPVSDASTDAATPDAGDAGHDASTDAGDAGDGATDSGSSVDAGQGDE